MMPQPTPYHPNAFSHRPRWAVTAVLTMIVGLGLGGCKGGAALFSAMSGPDKVPPQFVLPDLTTAVLVDDPQHHLANPAMARQIGTTAVHHLQLNDALDKATFIEPREVARLERQLGRDWKMMPIDQIGQKLGAEQIIYAKIIQVSGQSDATLFRPTATIDVKVIRSSDGLRLWPEAPPLADPDAPPAPGYRLSIEMQYESRQNVATNQGIPGDLVRVLADDLGLKLAQLFYEWTLPEPGESL